jgi:mannose-6-phosphate isomerase-like protein (cupin superfamily)
VLEVGQWFVNRRTGAMIEITAWPVVAGPGKLQIRRVMRPGMGFPIPHVHLDLDETFKIEAGVGDARVGHRAIRLGEGEEFWVPRYDMHVNPCNRSTADLVLLHTFESSFMDAAERYVATLACYIEEGRDVRGDLPPLVAMAVFAGREQQTFGQWLPRGLQRTIVFPLAKSLEERRWNRRDREAEVAAQKRAGDRHGGWLRLRRQHD